MITDTQRQSIKNATDGQLKEWLVTCDGLGKEYKDAVYEEQMERYRTANQYPSYVICVDGEPLVENNGAIALYQEGDEEELKDRFLAMVYLEHDSSRITVHKYDLIPHQFTKGLSKEQFLKAARETYREG